MSKNCHLFNIKNKYEKENDFVDYKIYILDCNTKNIKMEVKIPNELEYDIFDEILDETENEMLFEMEDEMEEEILFEMKDEMEVEIPVEIAVETDAERLLKRILNI